MLRICQRVKRTLLITNAKKAEPLRANMFGWRCIKLTNEKCKKKITQFCGPAGLRYASNIASPSELGTSAPEWWKLDVSAFKSLCSHIQPSVRLLTEDEKRGIRANHPLSPYLSSTKKFPLHPITGAADFRFIEEPLVDDPVISKLNTFGPSDGATILLQAHSGAGKTGSLFARAKRDFVFYINLQDSQDLLFSDFKLKVQQMIEWTKDMNLSGTLQTELFRVMTQLLWLSQAILLSKVHPLTPEAWIAYLTSDGAIYARNINQVLNNWLFRSLKEHGIELGQLGRLAQRLDSILGNLATRVFFAIDEAQIAETLFPEVEFTALNSERSSFLSVLALYSRPRELSTILLSTGPTRFSNKSFGLKWTGRYFDLAQQIIDYPVVSMFQAADLVSQYFNDSFNHGLGLDEIACIAHGRIDRCANLLTEIWNENNNESSKGRCLDDMITVGIQKLKSRVSYQLIKKLDDGEEIYK